jgi:hypothetical protein
MPPQLAKIGIETPEDFLMNTNQIKI